MMPLGYRVVFLIKFKKAGIMVQTMHYIHQEHIMKKLLKLLAGIGITMGILYYIAVLILVGGIR